MTGTTLTHRGPGSRSDRDECLVAVRLYVAECASAGVYPGLNGYEDQARRRGWPGSRAIENHLGSWRKALSEVGIAEPRERGGSSVTTADCIAAVRAYAAEAQERGEYPGQKGYQREAAAHKWPSFTTVKSRLGPWTGALEKAGVTPQPAEPASREACILAISAHVAESLAENRYPARSRYAGRSSSRRWPPVERITEVLGSWPQALALGGLERPRPSEGPFVTPEDCIEAIQEYVEECEADGVYPGTVRYDQYRRDHGWPDRHTCIYARLGSWPEALEAAGFTEILYGRRPEVSRETCVAAVRAYVKARKEAGLTPTLDQYQAMATRRGWPARGTVMARLGSWREALKAVDDGR